MTWDLLNIIGTIAFAISGALVAMEEDYDILGVFILGLVTAFGGGILRNVLIGLPVDSIWEQGLLLKSALASMGIVFFMPESMIQFSKRSLHFFDAIGLSAFAIQGAIAASSMNHPISAVIVAAILTGIGGGMIRDVLAGRKPVVLREEIYAVWALLGGLVVGLNIVNSTVEYMILFVSLVIFRMLSLKLNWRLPHRAL
ncbi:trimeric intracellular cation channel family protein [Fictibacillus sp. 5RED26]|uniref:trimeric intracellular cation channel family protein n=1 Tax=unclassified Fictibacillus TaxID=2644029 RepID=UPI0018CF6438|nr:MULTISPECIES: trimeric intracellular cation channel family protein [unclassified Fictibacillus]MBH0156053.1 trimeric intracellular cation channel family protein [Fictibacillus sp. 5RED26]MBH0165727.1 trimeric intracellular cation channel family protein [Fictibacillus sp. 7GRE50]MBH0173224.1 trimeric intracellular cation channel family protein [Fictibacillus sp. 23RED33]